jgi:hypothetical protein
VAAFKFINSFGNYWLVLAFGSAHVYVGVQSARDEKYSLKQVSEKQRRENNHELLLDVIEIECENYVHS